MESKQKLLRILLHIQKRYNSSFFSKLVLFEGKEEEAPTRVACFDVQREAASNIADILQIKIKATQFKCFYLIKNCGKFPKKVNRKVNLSSIKSNRSRKRSICSNRSRNSRNAMSHTQLRYDQSENGSHEVTLRPIVNRKDDYQSEISDIDDSMRALMARIKDASQRLGSKNIQDPNSQNQQSRLQKQQLIMSKMSQFQNEIFSLMDNERYETYSNNSRTLKPNYSQVNTNNLNYSQVNYSPSYSGSKPGRNILSYYNKTNIRARNF